MKDYKKSNNLKTKMKSQNRFNMKKDKIIKYIALIITIIGILILIGLKIWVYPNYEFKIP